MKTLVLYLLAVFPVIAQTLTPTTEKGDAIPWYAWLLMGVVALLVILCVVLWRRGQGAAIKAAAGNVAGQVGNAAVQARDLVSDLVSLLHTNAATHADAVAKIPPPAPPPASPASAPAPAARAVADQPASAAVPWKN